MADEEKQPDITLPHVEAPHFRSVFANGAVFTGPADSSKTWLLTFYSEGVQVVTETLVLTETGDGYRHAIPPRIETRRVRRDEVCVIIPEGQLTSLLNAVAATMKARQE